MDPTLTARTLDMAVNIQQIPGPTFQEGRRSAFVRERFLAERLCDVGMDDLGNVFGRLPGEGKALPLILTAHMDTVFPIGTDLQARRSPEQIAGPGIGDNSLGVAGLFGLLWALQVEAGGDTPRLPGDLWLVANVGEEGLGDLRGMRAVVDRFGSDVLAYLVLEGMALGQIYHRGLAVQRYRLHVRTQGGHSWVDHGRPSAVHELASLVTRLAALPLPARPRTTLNVGVISGGTTVNTIAAEANCDVDLRSEGEPALLDLVRRVETLAMGSRQVDVQVRLEVIGRRPAGKISTRHPLVRLARSCLEEQGIRPNLSTGSTDANIPLSRGLPAICLGLTTGGGAHTVGEYIHTHPVEQGLEQLLTIVQRSFREL